MPGKIRVGVIGCGKIAKVSHVPRLKEIRGVEVAALCDTDSAKSESLRAELVPDARVFTDFRQFLKCGLDAVSICTPNNFHCPMALEAFKAGLHVLCEKPMAGTLADATRMIKAAKKAGKVLHINQSLRYHPPYVTVAELVNKGAIGRPLHVRCIRASGRTPDKGWSPGATWFVSKKHQGGIVLDIGIHMADLLRWIAGDVEEIASFVQTRTPGIDVPDHVSAIFRFANGATGVLELSWSLPVGASVLEVYGTEGRIRMGYGEQPVELTRLVGTKTRTTYPKVKARVKNSFQCFIEAVRGKSDSPTPGELGREALALCDAIARSGGTGRFVKVKRFN